MQLEWVNHASFTLSSGRTRLICDPWLTGPAFEEGWRHLVPTPQGLPDWNDITHIWISHEHPDHFAPRDLLAIPADIRSKITVLHQRTSDQRVARFCRKAGFDFLELDPARLHRLPGLAIRCAPHLSGDSWLWASDGSTSLLNLNDCAVRTRLEMLRILRACRDRHPTLLLTQFSYACWAGNPGELDRMRAAAVEVAQRMEMQVEVARPHYTVPFANLVYFAHQENHWQNEGMLTLEEAWRLLRRTTATTPLAFYPGDAWTVGDPPPDPHLALDRYAPHYAALRSGNLPLASTTPVPLEQLQSQAQGFLRRLGKAHSTRLLLGRRTALLAPVHLRMSDLDQVVTLSFSGLEVPRDATTWEVELSSGALSYALRYPWGADTLAVSGRFRERIRGSSRSLQRWIALAENANRGASPSFLTRLMVRARRSFEAGVDPALARLHRSWTGPDHSIRLDRPSGAGGRRGRG